MTRERAVAWALELQAAHHQLETQLRDARAEVSRLTPAQPSPQGDLLVHCVGFCKALQAHHESEDDHLFPLIVEQDPALTPTIEALKADHIRLAGLLGEFRAILDQLRAAVSPQARGEADRKLDVLHRLVADHFASEENKLNRALHALQEPPDHRRQLLGL
ncbi:hemerythrin-like domain-containing protein [Naumannella cuiyingiana]|uniref:Hemerythrin-like domain-containing protein n=1 Tax=Naumannella cuiyingiana TaxID=1347891 RepID=A0A7Z0IKP5_9ACTN|nr:hemerythrin domain-containing protein [Naumannella cuiyingiana]NYI70746.1 hemerythrin-like domain-containing protein [Naumannella cuiyingiana]